MGMKEIEIGGRKVPLMLSVQEMVDIQEDLGCTVGQLRDEVFGIEVDPETDKISVKVLTEPRRMKKLGILIRILGNAGLEESGKEADLTDRWVLRHMVPALLSAYVADMLDVVNRAMILEVRNKEEGPVDEVLEEQNRKKEPGN